MQDLNKLVTELTSLNDTMVGINDLINSTKINAVCDKNLIKILFDLGIPLKFISERQGSKELHELYEIFQELSYHWCGVSPKHAYGLVIEEGLTECVGRGMCEEEEQVYERLKNKKAIQITLLS